MVVSCGLGLFCLDKNTKSHMKTLERVKNKKKRRDEENFEVKIIPSDLPYVEKKKLMQKHIRRLLFSNQE